MPTKQGVDGAQVEVRGSRNRVAGRDYVRANVVHLGESAWYPDPRNPNLITCPHCHRPGMSREALLCPSCGFSMQVHAERLVRLAQARRFRVLTASLVTALAALMASHVEPLASEVREIAEVSPMAIAGALAVGAVAVLVSWIEAWRSFR